MIKKYYRENYQIIFPEYYLNNIKSYQVENIKIFSNAKEASEELLKDGLKEVYIALVEKGYEIIEKSLILDFIVESEISYDYVAISLRDYEIFEEIADFIFEFVDVVDLPNQEKYEILRKMYFDGSYCLIKLKRAARNIGIFPVDQLKTSSLMDALKASNYNWFYW